MGLGGFEFSRVAPFATASRPVLQTHSMTKAQPEERRRVRRRHPHLPGVRILTALTTSWLVVTLAFPAGSAETETHGRPTRRDHGMRLRVDPRNIRIMDGDTAEISWSPTQKETVRVLGIDTPELFKSDGKKNLAGLEARGFAKGAFAMAGDVQLLRARTLDRFNRTLGYFFLDGRNYSVLVLRAGMASETVTRFGNNGFPHEAEEVIEASRSSRHPSADR